MAKGGGQLTDRDATYDNPSRAEPKRSHQWFAEAEPELFPNKKQAVHTQNSKAGGSFNANPGWENHHPPAFPAVPSVPSQFMDRYLGGEIGMPFNFNEHNDGIGDYHEKKGVNEQIGSNSCLFSSVAHSMEGPETCLSYGGLRKVKVNQVKDSDNGFHAPKEHTRDISVSHVYSHGNEASFISMGQGYGKEDGHVLLMGHTYNKGDGNIRSIVSSSEKGNDNSLSFQHHGYNKGDTTALTFGGFQEEPVMDQLARPLDGYGLVYDQTSNQTSEIPPHEELNAPSLPPVNAPKAAKPKSQSVPKNKTEPKAPKKEVANSFPSNVRSLMSTGMLEGLPVKYVSLSKEELGGIVKGSGYLCGCQSCNYTKALNAYEFERHAGCKTKHPNNHIYFESGKTIYQIVQELKSTPEKELFDVMQTITGSPINQKSFRIWKESFQVASRELHRIYAKEERKLE